MDLWEDTRELEIYYDEERSDPEKVAYRLYEPNFVTAMKFIFQSALRERREKRCGERQQEKSNILAFIGRRGAGKTTAMMEFCRILGKMRDMQFKDWWVERVIDTEAGRMELLNKKFSFHVLPPIDASLLTASDDLLELILSNIYQEYEKLYPYPRDYGTMYSDAMIRIDKLFEELLTMYRASAADKRNSWQEDYTVLSIREQLCSSSLVTLRIGELIDELIKFNRNHSDREYFVIAIDDLDLNFSHGYQMLEQLQKYFADSRILILITMDYEQMWRVCAEHIHHEMSATDENDAEIGNELHSRDLANDFMTKMFPLQQRLFLPDMKKQGNRMLIQLGEESHISIKSLMMEKVADRMQIFYDTMGSKKHFCEPDTVRNLVDYNNFLNSLIPVDYAQLIPMEQLAGKEEADRQKAEEKNRRLLRQYDQNHTRFNWDIMERQAQLTLSSRQHPVFRQLLEFPLERRMMYFIRSVKNPDTRAIRLVDVSTAERQSYRYGDLLEKIYTWGRTDYEDKPFISCVMASFTSEMVREYVNYRYLPNKERREKSWQRLKAFLGVSFSNEWVIEGLFPSQENIVNRKKMISRIGYDIDAGLKTRFVFGMENLTVKKSGPSKGMVKDLKKWLKKEEIIETLECLDMFLSVGSDRDYQGPEMIFELTRMKDDEDKSEARKFSVKFEDGCVLDIMGFVGKSLNYAEHKGRMQEKIAAGLNKILKEYFDFVGLYYNAERMKEELLNVVDELSVFTRYWDPELSPETALPFYDLDLMYNIIKRIRTRHKELVSKDNIYDKLLELYETIESGLEIEEKSYINTKMRYREIFRACPYIYALRDFKAKERTQIIERISTGLYATYDYSVFINTEPEEPSD